MRQGYSHALYPALAGLQDLKPQAILRDHLALLRNAPGHFADKARHSCRPGTLRPYSKEFLEPVHVHIPRDHIG